MSIQSKIEELKNQRDEANDVVKATAEVANSIQMLAQQGFKFANETNSIDDKIKLLIQTIQSMANDAIVYHNEKEEHMKLLDIKISLLEEVLMNTEEEAKSNEVIDQQSAFSFDKHIEEDNEKKESLN